MNFNFLKDNKGVTLVTMVMVIIVITIIVSISIIGGTEIIKNARESKAKEKEKRKYWMEYSIRRIGALTRILRKVAFSHFF